MAWKTQDRGVRNPLIGRYGLALSGQTSRTCARTRAMASQHSAAMTVQAHRLDAIAATRHGHVSIVNLTMSGGWLTVARTIPDSWPRNPDRPARPSSLKKPRRRAAWFRPDYRGNSSRQPANGMSQESVCFLRHLPEAKVTAVAERRSRARHQIGSLRER